LKKDVGRSLTGS